MKWVEMSPNQKAAAVETILRENPVYGYTEVAKILGTTPSAVSGAMFRVGKTKLYAVPRPVNPKAHPVVVEVFKSVYARGLSDRDIAKGAGYAMETVWGLRTGVRNAKLQTISNIAEMVGLELYVRPKQ